MERHSSKVKAHGPCLRSWMSSHFLCKADGSGVYGTLFSNQDTCEMFFLDFRFLDMKEKGTPATVFEFCLGNRKKFVRIAGSSRSLLGMSGKHAFLNHFKTACKKIRN